MACQINQFNIPFVNLLSPEDQTKFLMLCQRLGSPENRYNRHQRLQITRDSFESLRSFSVRGDSEDGIRFLVCGLCWLSSDVLAINTKQMKNILCKSKSSINGTLTLMKYFSDVLNPEEVSRLVVKIPFLQTHPSELRQWTLRRQNWSDSIPKQSFPTFFSTSIPSISLIPLIPTPIPRPTLIPTPPSTPTSSAAPAFSLVVNPPPVRAGAENPFCEPCNVADLTVVNDSDVEDAWNNFSCMDDSDYDTYWNIYVK
jgi:hypothetical protein